MRHFRLAALLVVASLVALPLSSCSHDWDDYEVLNSSSSGVGVGAGSGSGGGSPQCAAYCDVETRCISSMTLADCLQRCATDTADCPSGQLDNITECAEAGQGECHIASSTAVCTCLATTTACFDCL